MTIIHKGIRRKTTDVLDDYGQAYYAQNWRFKRLGEIGRRPGLGKSNMAQLAGPVRAMITGNMYFPYLVQVTGGDVTATLDPLAFWTDTTLKIPDGEVGQPTAPVIVSITPSPVSGTPWIVGQVTFTAVINYDGLSGPLVYLWETNQGGPASPIIVTDNANPGVYDFDANCIPGDYLNFNFGVSTTDNPLLSDSMLFNFTVG